MTQPRLRYFNPNTNNDRWVVEQVFDFKKNGYFIEAGACDGIEGSNTFALELQLDWTGICVEPGERWLPHLQRNRRCSIDTSCLASDERDVEFRESAGYGGISDFLSEGKREHWESGPLQVKRTATLESVLDKHNAPAVIDFLALDVEGAELDILKVFPFGKYTILAMSIEGRECTDFLLQQGFVHVQNAFNKKAPYEQNFLHASLFSGTDARRLIGQGLTA